MSVYYHYTSLQTFLAISESSTIRLTDLKRSNDYLEGQFLVKSLASYLSHLGCPPHFVSTCESVVSSLVSIYAYFGFCLTTEGDDLGQWRAYGNQGCGVAIGFDVELLLDTASKTKLRSKMKLIEVKYGHEAILEWMDEIYKILPTLDLESKDPWGNPEKVMLSQDPIIKPLYDALERFSTFCFNVKNSSFSLEKEVRIVQEAVFSFSNGLKFFERQGRIVPYLDVVIDPICIDSIVIGSRVNADGNEVRRVLTAWSPNLADVKIFRSGSSFRL